jgi:uncharacterized protein YfcZ (UPF0381/DUF406 family)
VWTELIEDPEMKVIEAKLREAQEQVHNRQAERVATLPPVEHMSTILAQRQAHVEVEKMRDQQNILQQRLGPLQEEAVRVIGELATVQGKVKQATIEAEEKLTNLTTQGAEEITTTEATIIKEVEVAKVASQNFISAWKSRKQA